MAHASVQVSPLRYPPGMAATSRHIAYLPSLWKESQHLSFASASLLGQRLGCLARLLLVRLERLQGLCRVTQHCPFRGLTHSLCSNHRTPISSFHSRPSCESRLVYRGGCGATVTTAGLTGPPDYVRKDVLEWLARIGEASLVLSHGS